MTTLLDPPPIPAWGLARDQTTAQFAFSATLPAEVLTERHRPRTLAEVFGQGAAVYQLQTFLDAPYPVAFLFEGPTGVGKTSAARALANDLGVDPDWGFEDIKSARADMDSVDRALRMLRHVAPGSGWKLVLVDESDLMTPKAAHLWLSALEDLPAKSVIVFTTNRPDHFPDRFLDRCERIRFARDGRMLRQDAQALVDSIWREETGLDDAPGRQTRPGDGRPGPRAESRDLTLLRVRLNDELAESGRIEALCGDALDALESARAGWKNAPRDRRETLLARVAAADAELTRLGRLALAIEAKLKATRAAIKRAGRAK